MLSILSGSVHPQQPSSLSTKLPGWFAFKEELLRSSVEFLADFGGAVAESSCFNLNSIAAFNDGLEFIANCVDYDPLLRALLKRHADSYPHVYNKIIKAAIAMLNVEAVDVTAEWVARAEFIRSLVRVLRQLTAPAVAGDFNARLFIDTLATHSGFALLLEHLLPLLHSSEDDAITLLTALCMSTAGQAALDASVSEFPAIALGLVCVAAGSRCHLMPYHTSDNKMQSFPQPHLAALLPHMISHRVFHYAVAENRRSIQECLLILDRCKSAPRLLWPLLNVITHNGNCLAALFALFNHDVERVDCFAREVLRLYPEASSRAPPAWFVAAVSVLRTCPLPTSTKHFCALASPLTPRPGGSAGCASAAPYTLVARTALTSAPLLQSHTSWPVTRLRRPTVAARGTLQDVSPRPPMPASVSPPRTARDAPPSATTTPPKPCGSPRQAREKFLLRLKAYVLAVKEQREAEQRVQTCTARVLVSK